MTGAQWRRVVALGAGCLALHGCTERLVPQAGICGDGMSAPGELCFSETPRSFDIGLSPLALRVGRFDGDDRDDVMVLGTDPAGIVLAELRVGLGEADLAAPTDPGVFGCSAHPVPGQLDDDAITDLLVDDCDTSVLLFLGTAQGRFQQPVSVGVAAITRSSAITDVDGDDTPDILLLGTGPGGDVGLTFVAGGFGPATRSTWGDPSSIGIDPVGFGIADVDDDGRADAVLVARDVVPGLALARATDRGVFGTPQMLDIDIQVSGLVLRDFSGDGRADLLVPSPAENALVLFEGDGAGGFNETARTDIGDFDPYAVALADLDADGDDEFILSSPDQEFLQVWVGVGDGTFTGPQRVALGVGPEQIAVAQLDDDGVPDLVVGTFAQGTVTVIASDP